MRREGIEFREGTASEESIQVHLEACDGSFTPRLSLKVNIGEYAKKIGARAWTFEAWSGDALVGLVAAYLDDRSTRTGFITSVSVAKEFMGSGIASTLLARCLARSREEGMVAIALEVSRESRAAIHLYEKLGFAELERDGETVVMRLTSSEMGQS